MIEVKGYLHEDYCLVARYGAPSDGDPFPWCTCPDRNPSRVKPGFTCPRCHRTSYNPNDLKEGYCGACHDWTGDR